MSENVVKLDRDEGGLVREETQSGIYVEPVYTPEDVKSRYEEDISDPGSYPFTRGIYPKMYRDRLWLKAFLVSYDTPESTNAAFRSYIENPDIFRIFQVEQERRQDYVPPKILGQ